MCGRDTVGAAWGLLEARVKGGSRAVASAGPGTTGHELGADITAVDVSYSASGWIVREAETARAGGGVVWSRSFNTHSVLDELVLLERSHGRGQPGLYGPPPCSKSDSYSTPYSS